MISIVEAPKELLLKRNKFKKQFQINNFLIFSISAALFGFIFSVWDVVVFFIIGFSLFFFVIIDLIYPTPHKENLIIRRAYIKNVEVIRGVKTGLRNLDLILEEDEKNPNLKNRFSILNDLSPMKISEKLDYSSAKTLIGKEIEIEYLEKSGYIAAIRFNPPFVLKISEKESEV